jgi:hypothetical protein
MQAAIGPTRASCTKPMIEIEEEEEEEEANRN